MDDDDAPEKPVKNDPSTALFLSLYLILLAFFIVLNAISTLEEAKTEAATNSLSRTFNSILVRPSDQTFTSQAGQVLATQEFIAEITRLFETAIQAVQIELVQPGQVLAVSFHPDSLFQYDDTTLRPGRMPMLQRMVASLAAEPPGYSYDMEAIFGLPGPDAPLPVTPTLAIRRATALARVLEQHGMPPGKLAVGLGPEPPNTLTFYFRTQVDTATEIPLEPTEAAPAPTGNRSGGLLPGLGGN